MIDWQEYETPNSQSITWAFLESNQDKSTLLANWSPPLYRDTTLNVIFFDAISQFLLLFAIAKWCDDRRRSYFWNFCRGMLRSMGPIFARKKGPSVRPTVLFDIIGAVAKNGFIARPYHQFWMICARSRPRLCTRKILPRSHFLDNIRIFVKSHRTGAWKWKTTDEAL